MVVELGHTLPDSALELELLDEHGTKTTLADVLGGKLTILIFLRHFGCLACSQHASEWKPRLREFTRLGAQVVFVGNGDPEHLQGFIDKIGLDGDQAVSLTDPTKKIYQAFGLKNSVGSTVGPIAMLNAMKALSQGHLQTSIEGDPLQQGGLAIIEPNQRIGFLHRERSLGDFWDVSEILEQVMSLTQFDNEGYL
ncbi:MAG: peroxiredoxin-like family protein [Verrucomicrobiota bacterium]